MRFVMISPFTFLLVTLQLLLPSSSYSCEEGKADIMFVLDESSSVGQKNFETTKSFVQNVVTNLPVGSDSVHVGLLKYGFGVNEEFDLRKYEDPSSLKNAIKEVGYDGGITNTHKALDYLRTNSFTASKGDREDAPNIAILITDGKSIDKEKTKEAAERLKAAGVTVFSIGVDKAVQDELEAIASKPSSEYVFYVEDVNGLDEIKERISSDICNQVNPCENVPCENFGKCIVNNTDYYCQCPEGFQGQNCSIDTNPCKPEPCENGGRCFRRGTEFVCICPTGYEGKICSDEIDYCKDNPCENGGVCYKEGSSFVCWCQNGFQGKTCSHQINPCNSNPCENSGKCFSNGPDYICLCPPGYEGKECSEEKNPCKSNPCKNGGNCSHDHSTYNCTCQDGFEGRDCSKVDPCASSPCKNGGTCFKNGENYLCACTEDYEGENCTSVADKCRSSPCLNGGTCITGYKNFTCICKNGFKGENCSFVCENMDLMFVLDDSGSVKKENFNLMKQFVKSVASSYAISNDGVRVGAIKFAKYVHNEFDLDKYGDINGVNKGIDGISYSDGSSTRTHKALKYLRTDSFTDKSGDRKHVPNVAVLISDGKSSDGKETIKEAEKLKSMGVEVYTIGVGNADEKELKQIASSPISSHHFSVKSFEDLDQLKDILQQETCKDRDFCLSSPCKNGGTCSSNSTGFTCSCTEQYEGNDCTIDKYSLEACGKADIAFALDYSKSVGSSHFKTAKSFVKNITSSFNIGADGVRTGAISFGKYVSENFKLNAYTTLDEVQAAVDKISYRGTYPTYTYKALSALRQSMFSTKYGNRPGVPDIAIIITDGIIREKSKAFEEAERLRNAGVTVYTIGVGDVKRDELEEIASRPSSDHTFIVKDFDHLNDIKKTMLERICESIKSQSG